MLSFGKFANLDETWYQVNCTTRTWKACCRLICHIIVLFSYVEIFPCILHKVSFIITITVFIVGNFIFGFGRKHYVLKQNANVSIFFCVFTLLICLHVCKFLHAWIIFLCGRSHIFFPAIIAKMYFWSFYVVCF